MEKSQTTILISDICSINSQKHYSGVNIARFILRKYREYGLKSKWCFVIGILVSIFHNTIPLIFKIYEKSLQNLLYYEFCFLIGLNLLNVYYFALNFTCLVFGVFEFDRQYRYLSQLSNLLSSKKTEKYHTKKYYPTINLFDNLSLKSWSKLHDIFRSYGMKYKLRIEGNLTVFILIYITIILTLIASVVLDKSFIYSNLTLCVFGFEILVVLLTILIVLKKGCAINDHYNIHLVLLKKNKNVLLDLLRLGDIYFEKNQFVSENPIYFTGVIKIKDEIETKLKNMQMHKRNINLSFIQKKLRKEILTDLIRINEEVIEQIKLDASTKPFSIMGFSMTSNVFTSILAIIFSLAFAIFKQIFFENLHEKFSFEI